MSINQPKRYNFPTHYRGDGLNPFVVKIKVGGDVLDLTGYNIALQMKVPRTSRAVYEFNSDGTGDALIEIIDATGGEFQFPLLNSWEIDAGVYDYDLQLIDSTGYVRTYLRGTWAVNQDITILD